MYRAPTCGHCRVEPGLEACPACDLWICEQCAALGCDRGDSAWTGKCRMCGTRFPVDQWDDVADGEGIVRCEGCGLEFPLVRLSRLGDRDVREELHGHVSSCSRCGRDVDSKTLDTLLVSREQWVGFVYFNLICTCGRALAWARRSF